MYWFTNDYSEGAHPKIIELMSKSNFEQNTGYGLDIHSEKARELIRNWINMPNADVHFIPGGTQTNLLVISSFLRPHQCVISADTGHINVHETGAIEATGHKVVNVPGMDGKLTPESIQSAVDSHVGEHMVQPRMVYISNSTELGTIYTKAELEKIRETCLKNGLLLYMDGARLGAALTSGSNDLSIEEVASLVDVFYIGGTKNGALLGEALVICKEELKEDFRYLMKQRAAMPAKGFVMGMQFEVLMQDGLYLSLAEHANSMAMKVADIFREKGYKFYTPPCTNQVFPILPNELAKKLISEFGCLDFTRLDEHNTCVRFVTSWATRPESVDYLRTYMSKI
ncbi:MAG: threonine aldolase family protein [Eubacteriales bacterium]|jgi:threonine aldolase